MTIKEYITCKLEAFHISEADMADISIDAGIGLDEEYSAENAETVGRSLVPFIERFVLAPRPTNVSENGFSMSWDYKDIGKFYLWLCKKYGITPDDDVVSMLGISVIKDITDCW